MTPLLNPNVTDDQPMYLVKSDISGGINSRQHASMITDNQAAVIYNVDIGIPGKRKKRPGSVLISNEWDAGDVICLHNYEIQGATDQLLLYENQSVYKWIGAGNWASVKTDFSSSTECGMISGKKSGLSPDDIVIVQNGVDNAFEIQSDGTTVDLGSTAGTGSDSPPKSTVMCWHNNRFWVLKDDLLYWSAAYSTDYSAAFDTVADTFRIPVGEERGLAATRDLGIIVMGKNGIWALAPSPTPTASDQPQPLITDKGVVSKNGWVIASDDIYFFSQDGFRALKRTVQDKLQGGVSYPISYGLKNAYDRISWAYISQLSMEYFDNKIFISVPTGAATFDTWVFYPATGAFMIITGWATRSWGKYKISGEEFLYYGKTGYTSVYQAWYGYTDEGTTTTNGTKINYQIEHKKENMGQPLHYKIGGEVGYKAEAVGDYNITISASFDEGEYNTLGTINLANTASGSTLPVTLPFNLSDLSTNEQKFHLDNYGKWKTIQIKEQHDATNGSDDISVLEHSIVTYREEYENE